MLILSSGANAEPNSLGSVLNGEALEIGWSPLSKTRQDVVIPPEQCKKNPPVDKTGTLSSAKNLMFCYLHFSGEKLIV